MKLKGLFLGRNNLTGEIPKSIGNLTSLTQIYLSDNNLEGHLPEELGQLTILHSIGIDVNFLSGTIPASLYNISSIAGISLSTNSLEGKIPDNVGLTLPNIQEFLIGGNQFEGTIPVSFANASLLAKLDLVGNKFRGQVPTNLGYLPILQWLNFAGNFLGSNSTGDMIFIASLSNCSNLQSLLFSQNNFGGTLPDSIGNLSNNLQQIDLALNQVSGEIPAGLGNLANLYLLGMDHNLFSGAIPSFFGKFRMLQKLFLNNNQLSGQIPPSLFNMTSLYGLYLSENRLEGVLPPIIGNSQSLREMILSKNNLNGSIPLETFSFLSSLTLLNLTYNSFWGALPTEIGELTNIYFLDISHNQFSGEIPETIADCTSLEYIYMQDNSFQGEIPPSLAYLKGIRVLDLAQNNLTGQIPKDLDMLPFVQLMNLSFNALEGEVPMIGFFSNASSLSLVGNSKLCGGTPELKLPKCPEEKQKKRKPLAPGFIIMIVAISLVLVVVASAAFCLIHFRRKRRRTPFIETDSFSGISYHELQRATKGFSAANLIGSGSFGSVYKGVLHLQGERSVAVKVLDLQKNGASKSFLSECIALRNIRHRNLVKVLTCCSSYDSNGREFKALVYEFMSNGDLDMWLHNRSNEMNNSSRALCLLQRLNIALDVAFALDYLHNQCENPVVHCDLKPSNVLLDDDLTAHVGDFGLARLLYENTRYLSQQPTSSIGIKGSLGYAAPEYGMGSQVSILGDVYSYGILLLELLTGRRPTDQLFIDGLSLHEYVKQAFPHISDILDPVLLGKEEEEDAEEDYHGEIIENLENKAIEKEVKENTRSPEIEGEKLKCLRSLFVIGLSCSSELPRGRMDMKDAVKELIIIKNVLVKITSST